jgi:hypothetical protein
MTHDPNDRWYPPPFSTHALNLFGFLERHGGTVRIGPLLRHSGLDAETLTAAINELAERCWVKIVRRPARASLPPGLPERFRAVERVATTGFGRFRFPSTRSTR